MHVIQCVFDCVVRTGSSCPSIQAPRDSAMNEAQGSDEVMDDKEESETGSEDSADDIEGGGSEDEGEGGTASRKHPGAAPKQKKRAAAAMTVGIGSFSDPVDLPGLSHYLEHMLVCAAS